MWCTDCESIETLIFDETVFWLHLPTTDSFGKIAALCGSQGYVAEQFNHSGIKITVAESKVKKLLTELFGATNAQERAGARIVTTLPSETPSELFLSRVLDLDTFINRYECQWIIDSLDAETYESWYQPIVASNSNNLETPEVFAHEALFRMRDGQDTVIPPSLVFSRAEHSELLFSLDLIARRCAVETAALANLKGKLFINFNPSSIYDPSYCLRTTASAINELGMKAENIVFEITETYRVTNKQHLKGILAFYRSAGFGVALDDIGSGWSGLNMLHEFAPDYVKLDMDLCRDVHKMPMKQSIVQNLLSIARKNGIRTIAEGIECAEEAEWLDKAGADYLQGFYFGKPKPLSAESSTEAVEAVKAATQGLRRAAG